jgi:alpha-galactosidase
LYLDERRENAGASCGGGVAGMEAVLRGSGDSFILGCNHPIWPSLGLIHGSRSSGDIKRTWPTIEKIARQNLNRNWQNGRLWWNDSDAVVLDGTLPINEFQFHATAVYASGGMILSGDDLTKMPPDRLAMLRKLLPPTGVAAAFEDESLRAGVVTLKDRRVLCLFNWTDQPQTVSVRFGGRARLRDYWSGEDLGLHERSFAAKDLPGRSAKLIEAS